MVGLAVDSLTVPRLTTFLSQMEGLGQKGDKPREIYRKVPYDSSALQGFKGPDFIGPLASRRILNQLEWRSPDCEGMFDFDASARCRD